MGTKPFLHGFLFLIFMCILISFPSPSSAQIDGEGDCLSHRVCPDGKKWDEDACQCIFCRHDEDQLDYCPPDSDQFLCGCKCHRFDQTFNPVSEKCECDDPKRAGPECQQCKLPWGGLNCNSCANAEKNPETQCQVCFPKDCGLNSVMEPEGCQCSCKPGFHGASPNCLCVPPQVGCGSLKVFDQSTCDCECQPGLESSCSATETFNASTCQCECRPELVGNPSALEATCDPDQIGSVSTCSCLSCPLKPLCRSQGGTPLLDESNGTCSCTCPDSFKWDGRSCSKTDVPTEGEKGDGDDDEEDEEDGCSSSPLKCINDGVLIPSPTGTCSCSCKSGWSGPICATCNLQCFGPGSRAAENCTCRCGTNLSGPNCSCISTPFTMTLRSLPDDLISMFASDADLAASEATLIGEITPQLNAMIESFDMGKDIIQISNLVFHPAVQSEPDENGSSVVIRNPVLVISATWSDGCSRSATDYDKKLTSWKHFLDAFGNQTLTIDDKTIDDIEITDDSKPLNCDYFDKSIAGRCINQAFTFSISWTLSALLFTLFVFSSYR